MKTNLKTKTARFMLEPRAKPYKTSIGHGLTLGYRRLLNGPGSWTAIGADGKGGQWSECFAKADDQSDPDGVTVLDYRQASERAIDLAKARGQQTADAKRSVTIDEALTAYGDDLRSRGQNAQNEAMVRHHLGDKNPLLAVLLADVTQEQLYAWRKSLNGRVKPATLQRMLKSMRAAFNLASIDRRVGKNAHAWKKGLPDPINATRARNAVLADSQVRQIVNAAYGLDKDFGLWVHVHAETGSRSGQIARLIVRDVEGTGVLMPNAGKGRGCIANKNTRTWIPIQPDLMARLKLAAVGKCDGDLLLVQPDGRSWYESSTADTLFRKAVAGIKPIDGEDVTMYALRHSSIVRAIRTNEVPLLTIAQWHNTSVAVIEKHYGSFMHLTHDAMIRPALVDLGPVSNVVPFAA
jgi:integrase